MNSDTPRRFRLSVSRLNDSCKHPNGSSSEWFYGCYFPQTDCCVGEMGSIGTGVPKDVEWLDEPSELMKEILGS